MDDLLNVRLKLFDCRVLQAEEDVVDVMRLLRAHGLAPVRSSGSTRRPASCSS